jgi:lipopolysaccharide transport protein LptA
MQDFHFKILLVLAFFAPDLLAAQNDDLKLPISLNADSSEYDGKGTIVAFRKLRLTQGSIGIEADEGRASTLDFEDSVWQLSGNVIIDIENGHIECDLADLTFVNYELTLATITGSPASFKIHRANSLKPTYAEAGRLEYDFEKGIIKFSEQATIIENGNQISSNYLVYNIKEQLINAQSGGDGNPKVRITYTPKDTVQSNTTEGNYKSNANNLDEFGKDNQ